MGVHRFLMSSGTALINRALQMIGVRSVVSPATPEDIQLGLELLNGMMEEWLSRNINISVVPLKVAGDDLFEPGDTTNPIIYNLAIQMAPAFDNGQVVVSPNLATNARQGMFTVQALYRIIPEVPKGVSGTLPVGAGNTRGVQQKTFFGPGGFLIERAR